MLKYLLGFVAGIAGLFIGVFIGVAIAPNSEKLPMALGAGMCIGAARGVYGYFRSRENIANYGTPGEPAIMDTDVRNFTKVFSEMDVVSAGITEVRIAERPDQTSFYVGIRANDFSIIDPSIILHPLKKMYYSHVQFEIVDLNSGKASLLQNGQNIPLPKA